MLQIEKSDIVRVRDISGPAMKVESISKPIQGIAFVVCIWFDEHKRLCRQSFNSDSLQFISRDSREYGE